MPKGRNSTAGWVSLLAIGVFAISISTEGFARIHGIQPLTILLLLLGLGQALLLERAVRPGSPRQSPALVAS